MTTLTPSLAEPEPFTVLFREQIDFLRGKVRLPTRTWRDIEGRAHDRAFVVAGVEKDEVLKALHEAIARAIEEGRTLAQFRQEFDAIVERHGWIGGAGEDRPAWRAKVIYETNIRTTYMAGRLKQMRDPDIVKLRPFWAYRHADTRVPLKPREQHVGWDGMVLRHDDPWWTTHFPPNGWGCSCGVRPLSRREMARHQAARGKLEAVDVAPPDDLRPIIDPLTGETRHVPRGVAEGWDHQPGDGWERGLVPEELHLPLAPAPSLPPASPLPALSSFGKPISVPAAMPGRVQISYIDDFLASFGARRGPGGAKLFRDVSGQAIPIGDALFTDSAGNLKTRKYTSERELALPRLAEALRDPDEVWVAWSDEPRPRLVRRYLRYDPAGGGFVSFAYAPGFGWSGATAFPPKIGKSAAAQEAYLDRERRGALLYRRQEK